MTTSSTTPAASAASGLTERYVFAVTRHLPGDTSDDVARELRGTIADAVDAKVAAGLTPDEAERAALIELGDPEVLARQFGGRPAYLIGPGVYPDWLRLIRLLPGIVLPVVFVANFVITVATEDLNWGKALVDAFLLALTVGVHLVFWLTLTFAVIEWTRPEQERDRPLTTWTPDHLGELTDHRVGLGETLVQAGFSIAFAALVAWQLSGVSGDQVQVLNPDIGVGWKVCLVGLIAFDAGLALLVWRAGRWTPSLAAVNVAANAAFATLTLWLLERGELLADLPRELADIFDIPANWSVPTAVVGAVIVLISGWDALDSVLKARRGLGRSRARA